MHPLKHPCIHMELFMNYKIEEKLPLLERRTTVNVQVFGHYMFGMFGCPLWWEFV